VTEHQGVRGGRHHEGSFGLPMTYYFVLDGPGLVARLVHHELEGLVENGPDLIVQHLLPEV